MTFNCIAESLGGSSAINFVDCYTKYGSVSYECMLNQQGTGIIIVLNLFLQVLFTSTETEQKLRK